MGWDGVFIEMGKLHIYIGVKFHIFIGVPRENVVTKGLSRWANPYIERLGDLLGPPKEKKKRATGGTSSGHASAGLPTKPKENSDRNCRRRKRKKCHNLT
jgi:hypothetical protein